MDLGQAAAHLRRDLERGAVHPERAEDVFLQIDPQLLPAHGFDRLACPVDADAVRPALTRVGQERDGQADILAAADPRNFLELLVAHQILAPQIVAPAAGVGEQMAQGERAAGWAQLRLTVGIPASQHLRAADFRDPAADRAIQIDLALLDKLHRRRAGDGFGHGRDPHHRIRRHPGRLRVVPLPKAAFVNHPIAVRRQSDDAGNDPCVRSPLQQSVGIALQRSLAVRGSCGPTGHQGCSRLQECSAIGLHRSPPYWLYGGTTVMCVRPLPAAVARGRRACGGNPPCVKPPPTIRLPAELCAELSGTRPTVRCGGRRDGALDCATDHLELTEKRRVNDAAHAQRADTVCCRQHRNYPRENETDDSL